VLQAPPSAAQYATWTAENDSYAVIGDPAGATSYPIVAATFILLPPETMDWAYTNGDKAAAELGYIPLPASTKAEIKKYWEAKKIK